jgi:hypothetical protein
MRSWLLALTLVLGCTPDPEVVVVSTRELGPLVTAEDVVTRERGYSFYAFGRSVWLFADGWSHTLDLDAEDGIGSFVSESELFTWTAEELAFNQTNTDAHLVLWPLTGVRDDSNDRVLVFYAKLLVSEASVVTRIGSSIAVWTDFEAGPVRPVLDAGSEEPTLLFLDPEPQFGQAALILDEQLYAYACADVVHHPCMLARVGLEVLFERDAWEFWTGHEWSPNLADALSLLEADTMFSVHYNPHVRRYLAFYGERERGEIIMRSALRPEGPWSPPMRVLATEAAITDVVSHGEFRRGGGQYEYLSYHVDSELRLVELELQPSD